MKNQILGTIMFVTGAAIISIVIGILYYLNAIGIWLSDVLGTSGDAGTGIQIIIIIVGIIFLLSVIIFGVALIVIGIAFFTNIAPYLLKTLSGKFFRNDFDDDFFRM